MPRRLNVSAGVTYPTETRPGRIGMYQTQRLGSYVRQPALAGVGGIYAGGTSIYGGGGGGFGR